MVRCGICHNTVDRIPDGGPSSKKIARQKKPKNCRVHRCRECWGPKDLIDTICSTCKIARNECFLCNNHVESRTYFCANHTCSFCFKGAETTHCAKHAGKQRTSCRNLECEICRQYPPSCSTCDKCSVCSRTLIISPDCLECPMPSSVNDRRCAECSCRVCPDVRLPGKDLCKTHCCVHCNSVMVDGRCFCMCTVKNCRNPCKTGSIECDSHICRLCKVTSLSHGHCSVCQCQYCNNIKLPGQSICAKHWCTTCNSVNYPICDCFCIFCSQLRAPGLTVCSDHMCKTCLEPYNGTCRNCWCSHCSTIGPCSTHPDRLPAKFMCRRECCRNRAHEGSRYCYQHSL